PPGQGTHSSGLPIAAGLGPSYESAFVVFTLSLGVRAGLRLRDSLNANDNQCQLRWLQIEKNAGPGTQIRQRKLLPVVLDPGFFRNGQILKPQEFEDIDNLSDGNARGGKHLGYGICSLSRSEPSKAFG